MSYARWLIGVAGIAVMACILLGGTPRQPPPPTWSCTISSGAAAVLQSQPTTSTPLTCADMRHHALVLHPPYWNGRGPRLTVLDVQMLTAREFTERLHRTLHLPDDTLLYVIAHQGHAYQFARQGPPEVHTGNFSIHNGPVTSATVMHAVTGQLWAFGGLRIVPPLD